MRGMERDVELECKCGAVHGVARGVAASTVNRVICLCGDCQTFAHHLERGDLLDASGGSDIIQIAPSSVSFDRGTDQIAAVRLGPKGPYRWYATCCKTPLGNTGKPSLPFIGIMHEAYKDAREPGQRDAIFGRPRGAIRGKDAIGEPPPGSTRMSLRLLGRTIGLILGWKVRGKGWPNPFFDRATGNPRYPVTVLTREQRDAARSKRGQ